MLSPLNGSFKNTIIIREFDDTYIFIKNYRTILLKANDFNAFDTIIQTNPLCNIIIDGRMVALLYYSILSQQDNILIYNIGERKISTIYAYVSDIYKVWPSQLTLNGLRSWAMILYIDTVCMNGILDIRQNELLKYITNNANLPL